MLAENKKKNFGFLLLNKPPGPTSHDMIDRLRQITKIKKIGHAGTLDPFASGLMLIAVNRLATKQISRFVKLDKRYNAELFLGATSTTFDVEGKIKQTSDRQEFSKKEILKIITDFQGKQQQIPPMFSAKKIKGKKLYQLARQGKEINRTPIEIIIYNIKILFFHWPVLRLNIHCSTGTYIRSLANDIGERLGCGAYLTNLKRTAIGPYNLVNAAEISDINEKNWQNLLFIPA